MGSQYQWWQWQRWCPPGQIFYDQVEHDFRAFLGLLHFHETTITKYLYTVMLVDDDDVSLVAQHCTWCPECVSFWNPLCSWMSVTTYTIDQNGSHELQFVDGGKIIWLQHFLSFWHLLQLSVIRRRREGGQWHGTYVVVVVVVSLFGLNNNVHSFSHTATSVYRTIISALFYYYDYIFYIYRLSPPWNRFNAVTAKNDCE